MSCHSMIFIHMEMLCFYKARTAVNLYTKYRTLTKSVDHRIKFTCSEKSHFVLIIANMRKALFEKQVIVT